MKAALINQHGSLDEIKMGYVDVPKLKSNELLVQTHYAALNHLDIFVTKGWSGLKLPLPHVLGSDGCGVIKEIGSDTSLFKPGDIVTINPGISCGKCSMCLSGQQNLCNQFSIKGENQWGTFSEYFTIPEVNALKLPPQFPEDQAAAAPLSFLTAWRMLVTKALVKYNDFVFIQGGSGGVSTCAIQIAKFFGAKVITSTSSDEKSRLLKDLGADYVINYRKTPDYAGYVFKEITQRRGIDIVIDSVGSATFETSLRMLRNGGKVLTCGATTGSAINLNIAQVFWKQLEILGSTMSNQNEFRQVMQLLFENKLKAVITKEFRFDEVQEAEKYLESGAQIGKVIIKV
jgi:NADPH:quinone reductase-like Zn-dependent oxidoreductase